MSNQNLVQILIADDSKVLESTAAEIAEGVGLALLNAQYTNRRTIRQFSSAANSMFAKMRALAKTGDVEGAVAAFDPEVLINAAVGSQAGEDRDDIISQLAADLVGGGDCGADGEDAA